jgi:hypothetical protein
MALPKLVSRAPNKSNLGSEGQTKKGGDREPAEDVGMELDEAGKGRMSSKLIKYHSPSLGV